jgi:thiol-disulfide isomerase/thioredoxin
MRTWLLVGLLGCASARVPPPTAIPPTAPATTPDVPEPVASDPPPSEDTRLRVAFAAQANGDLTRAKELLIPLAEGATNPRVRDLAATRLREILLIGTEATPLDVDRWYTPKAPTLNDTSLSVLVFFESWCPHCQVELPLLPALACRWEPRGAQVVLLTKRTRGVTDADVQRDIVTHGLFGLAVGHEREGAMSTAYAVTGIPAAAVVKDGRVLWRGHPAELDDVRMEGWLGAPPSEAPCAPARGFGP